MIKDVLRGIKKGKTLAEIAEELNMEYTAILGMVEHLVKMGYLIEKSRSDDQILMCKTCTLYRICSKKGPKIYYLTEKGNKVIKQ